MRKLYTRLVCFICLFSIFFAFTGATNVEAKGRKVVASDEEENSYGIISWKLYSDGTLVFDGSGRLSGTRWKRNADFIKAVEIKGSISCIAQAAFLNMKNLKKVTISSDVAKIEENAFHSCKRLKTVTLGKGKMDICDRAFSKCPSLSKIVISKNVKYVGSSVFADCSSLKDVYIKGEGTSFSPHALGGTNSGEITVHGGLNAWNFVNSISYTKGLKYEGDLE